MKKFHEYINESIEDKEPASPDEGSMAVRQLEFIKYAADEVAKHVKSGKDFPEWFQNKLTKAHASVESLYASMDKSGED